jgi:hypothetical protein
MVYGTLCGKHGGGLKYPIRERARGYGHGKDESLSWAIAAGRLGSKEVLEHPDHLMEELHS